MRILNNELNNFTCQLLLPEEKKAIPAIGTNAERAIRTGVLNSIVYEMDGCIKVCGKKSLSLLVFLTSGHSNYFERRLKNSIFADINLVLTGLNRIFEYNVEN